MNAELVLPSVAVPARSRSIRPRRASTHIGLRPATIADAPALHELIATHLVEGRLLPRSLDNLAIHAPRFVVATRRKRVVGCAELAPLSAQVAEVRSLVVAGDARALGVGRALVSALEQRARSRGFEQLCVFAHDPEYFVRRGFSLAPHTWFPEKIAQDCAACPVFRRCGQHALVLPLRPARG